jgi:hypothetical protein
MARIVLPASSWGRLAHPRPKYGAQAVTLDGIRFASKREANRYAELLLLFRAREISELSVQPKYTFTVDGRVIFTYIADFSYVNKDLNLTVEDAKGFRTPVYRLKKKLIEAQHHIAIIEV